MSRRPTSKTTVKTVLACFTATVIVPADEMRRAQTQAAQRRQAAADRWNAAHPGVTHGENVAALLKIFAAAQAQTKARSKTRSAHE